MSNARLHPEGRPVSYTPARPVNAEGMRIGLVACTLCGAALVLDAGIDFDVLERHDQWHEAEDAT